MMLFSPFFVLLSLFSAAYVQTTDVVSSFAADSLSKEASAFRKEIRSGHLPLVLSDKEKDLMNEILFYEQDSLERVERAAEIKRAGEKEEGSRSGTNYSVGFIGCDDPDSPYKATSLTNPANITTPISKQDIAYNAF